MLVLSRKRSESIVIDLSNPEVLAALAALPPAERVFSAMVVEIRGDKTRLAMDVPKCIPVHRREVYDAIERNKDKGHAA